MLRQQAHGNGAVKLRPPRADDAAVLIAARDDVFRRWLGTGSDNPSPTACIVLGEKLVGWIDYDHDAEHDWLGEDAVNIGYSVFAEHRGNGYATWAVQLLLRHLARDTQYTTATLLIDPENEASLSVARRCGFERQGEVRGLAALAHGLWAHAHATTGHETPRRRDRRCWIVQCRPARNGGRPRPGLSQRRLRERQVIRVRDAGQPRDNTRA